MLHVERLGAGVHRLNNTYACDLCACACFTLCLWISVAQRPVAHPALSSLLYVSVVMVSAPNSLCYWQSVDCQSWHMERFALITSWRKTPPHTTIYTYKDTLFNGMLGSQSWEPFFCFSWVQWLNCHPIVSVTGPNTESTGFFSNSPNSTLSIKSICQRKEKGKKLSLRFFKKV